MGRFRFLLAFLGVLAFSGQSLAALDFHCGGMGGPLQAGPAAHGPAMDHAGHGATVAGNPVTNDCCSQVQCGPGGCAASTAALTGMDAEPAARHASVLNGHESVSRPLAPGFSLYRPPISR